jgi:hypothetical protein
MSLNTAHLLSKSSQLGPQKGKKFKSNWVDLGTQLSIMCRIMPFIFLVANRKERVAMQALLETFKTM